MVKTEKELINNDDRHLQPVFVGIEAVGTWKRVLQSSPKFSKVSEVLLQAGRSLCSCCETSVHA